MFFEEARVIQVNEIFGPTVQGEGKSAGKACAFLRLANCNLHCIWCDTPHTWNWVDTPFEHPDKYVRSQEVHKMTDIEVLEKLEAIGVKFLVVSGGEPFMQQKQLLPLFHLLKLRGWWIEVETNGTLVPIDSFIMNVDQVNCSPKLANNKADALKRRIVPRALTALAREPKVNFKFVIETEDDLAGVLDLCDTYKFREVRLMPECRTKQELLKKERWLDQICRENGFIYCTRLSILMSGTKRGV